MIGPGDLSVLSGIPCDFENPIMLEARKRVARAAKAAGIHWGMPSGNPAHTAEIMELGARFICHGADILMIKQGLEQIQKEYAPLGFSFDNRIAAMNATPQKSAASAYARK
jgi:4-hydroxy-2-oxoheptanedioate aldolase